MAVALAQSLGARRRVLDLEAFLVWAIRNQQADRDGAAWFDAEVDVYNTEMSGSAKRGFVRVRPSADGCTAIANRAAIGTDIDGGGPIRGIPPRVHPDAGMVAEMIDRLRPCQRRLVLHHAREADRPAWLALVQPLVAVQRPSDARGRYRHVLAERWEPMPKRSEIAARYFARGISLFDALGRRRIVEEERGFHIRSLGDASRQVAVRWCPVEPRHSNAEVTQTNAEYAAWHAAMTTLADRLSAASLRDHAVTAFTAPARPWDNNP